jgi:hypothetical protein
MSSVGDAPESDDAERFGSLGTDGALLSTAVVNRYPVVELIPATLFPAKSVNAPSSIKTYTAVPDGKGELGLIVAVDPM